MNTINHIARVLLLSVISMTAVHADELGDAKSLTVQFADLDLSKPQGAATLFGRIKAAANNVCAPLNGATLVQKQEYARCVDFALTNAVARVDRPVLSEYFTNHSPPQAPIKVANGR